MNYILISLVSIIVASISIVGGLGGGVILVPLLVSVFGVPLKVVIGSVLISLVVPASIGAWGAWRRHELDFKLALLFETPTAIGAYFGARITTSLPDEVIIVIFSSISLFLSVNMIKKSLRLRSGEEGQAQSRFWSFVGNISPVRILSKQDEEYHISIPSLILFGLIIGTLSGMLGVGGGWIKTPLLIIGFQVPTKIATGTALFMILITALVGGTTHILEGNADYWLILSLGIGLGIGANIGNYLRGRMKAHHISLILGITLFIISLLFVLPVFL